jgi:hypothetical protein
MEAMKLNESKKMNKTPFIFMVRKSIKNDQLRESRYFLEKFNPKVKNSFE